MDIKENVIVEESGSSQRVEIPFQYVWVEASVREADLASRDPESLLKKEFDSLCRIRFQEVESDDARSLRLHAAWRMHASCPFCTEGADQPLHGGNWAYVHDWHRDEVDALSGEQEQPGAMGKDRLQDIGTWSIENPLNVEFIRDALGHWGARDGEGPDGSTAERAGRNAYGVRLLDVREASMGQLGFSLQGVGFLTRDIGVEGYFGGLYRCAHCGGMFAVVYRDRKNPRRQGRYELHEDVDAAISLFIDRTRAMRGSAGDGSVIPTMSAEIAQEEGLVSLRLNVAGRWHKLDFDTERGTILVDGSSYVHKEFHLHDLLGHPLVRSGLFNVRALVDALSSRLAPLPDDVAFFKEKFLGERNLLLLIAANRFRGYPAEFYNDLAGMDRFYKVYPLGTGLPRDGACLLDLYRMTGLPEKKSLKRTLFNRPLVLYELLQEPDLPFRNVDILRRFFEHRYVSSLIECMNVTEHSCAGWRQVANAKGEDYLLRMLFDKPSSHISAISKFFEYAHGQPLSMDMDELFDLSSREFSRRRACFEWQHDHPDKDIDRPYRYEPAQSDLEWEVDGLAFVLPRDPRDLIVAATDLSNCLDRYVSRIGDDAATTIVLVREDDMVVGAIEVSPSMLVTQALAIFNKPIESIESLKGVFVKWMDAKGLDRATADSF